MPKPAAREPPPRIVAVQALAVGVILHVEPLAIEMQVEELIFPPERFPEGRPSGVVLTHWRDRFDQFYLILSPAVLRQVSDEIATMYVLATPFSPTETERMREQDVRRAEQHEAWLDTYNGILGRTPREALKHPGWFERRGHIVWIGHDPHEFHGSIQIVPLSEVDEVLDRVHYYLHNGMSLLDAIRHISSADYQAIKAVALALAGYPDIALGMIEQQGTRERAIVDQGLIAELDAERRAIEAELRAVVKKLSAPPRAAQATGD